MKVTALSPAKIQGLRRVVHPTEHLRDRHIQVRARTHAARDALIDIQRTAVRDTERQIRGLALETGPLESRLSDFPAGIGFVDPLLRPWSDAAAFHSFV